MDNEYSKEILKQSVARACAALGIKQARYECVEILADVIRNFIQTTAAAAHENAELAGRACVGIQDIMPALEQVVSRRHVPRF
jgi:histone H3/H4